MPTEVSGEFVKIVWVDDPDVHLMRSAAERPPARFNRLDQDASYLSPDVESAKVAAGQDVDEADWSRVVLTFQVERCALFDLRSRAAADIYSIASKPWRTLLADGGTPPSWHAAEKLGENGFFGLIDPRGKDQALAHHSFSLERARRAQPLSTRRRGSNFSFAGLSMRPTV